MKGPERYAETGVNHQIHYKYRSIPFSGRSRFQAIDIVDTLEYGRMLFLDGVANSSERDEFIYHEALVHPAALTHPQPRSVLVIGGAEGATIREILLHPDITRVVMVDVDEELVAICRKHLADWSAGAFEDPRLELIFGDGRAYLANTDERFDLIYIDLSDPVPDSPAVLLFTRQFYRLVYEHLTEDGAACFQGESVNPWRLKIHAHIYNTLKTIFPVVLTHPYNLPCFHEPHAVILASKKHDPQKLDMEGRIKARGLTFRYWSADLLEHFQALPKYLLESYEKYTEPITDENPMILQVG